ncbi:MAG TPA: RHS repeat domain-containing protein [Puia sp.]|nr:RHS repeat domain-containing protein [Puia sp.]
MKFSALIIIIVLVSLAFAACQKEKSREGGRPLSRGQLVRIQQGTDPDLSNDTVHLITYDQSGRITALIDSSNLDTLVPAYDDSGRIASILERSPFPSGSSAHFTYDDSNRLTGINYYMAGSNESFYFEYTNGVVSKKSYYSDLGSGGSATLQSTFLYNVSGGNITDILEFKPGGVPVGEWKATYSGQANPFRTLSLFNYGNILGMGSFLFGETWFNKNMLSTLNINGSVTATNVYSFNALQAPIKLIADDPINNGLFTWIFSYN